MPFFNDITTQNLLFKLKHLDSVSLKLGLFILNITISSLNAFIYFYYICIVLAYIFF